MKSHFLDNVEWHEVPEDQAEDWDKFYRYVTAYLLGHGIHKAMAVVELDGAIWTLTVDLKRLEPEQIN